MALKNILLGVPTMAGIMKAKTASTLVMMMKLLTRAGVNVEYLNIDSSDIVYARNFYAKVVLNSNVLDGLLFVDSDMHFRPELILRMLGQGGDVVGVAYPKRELNVDRYSQAIAEAGVFTPETKTRALASTYQYTVVPSWDAPTVPTMQIQNGFTKMAAVGMGCTLISKAALEAMVAGAVVQPRKDIIEGVEQNSHGFFDFYRVGDISLSEDFSFCYRWTRLLKRDLWVCVDEPITHLGDFSHTARYLDRLRIIAPDANAPPPAEAPIEIDSDLVRSA